ncbi:hypothetical protein EYF80_060892 [Liparis tanakae]|uniref:Uncharacterized protein n=1 Tax=Liparis tanakae TaxID=230148 RepID=A0A4Z2EK62_9TELE|nr:hypothetical protein EYF80_060892 [Liparis tanakae]
MMGYETADGQNGGPKPVQASNPPLYPCASVGPADSAKEPAPHFPLRYFFIPEMTVNLPVGRYTCRSPGFLRGLNRPERGRGHAARQR